MIRRAAIILTLAPCLGVAAAIPESVQRAASNLAVAALNLPLGKGQDFDIALWAYRREAAAWIGADAMPPSAIQVFPTTVFCAPTLYEKNAPALTPTASSSIKVDVGVYLLKQQAAAKEKLKAYVRGLGQVGPDDPRVQVLYTLLDTAEILLGRLAKEYNMTILFVYHVPDDWGLPAR